MARIDDFNTEIAPVGNIWTVTDAWVGLGGKWLTVQFTGLNPTYSEWKKTDNGFVAIDIDGVLNNAPVVHVTSQIIGGTKYVNVMCRVENQINRSQVLTAGVSIPLATNPDGGSCIITQEINVRNYSNVDSSGDLSYPLRTGNTENNIAASDPRNDASAVVRLRASDGLNGGFWTGLSDELGTENGSMSYIASDPDFNDLPTIQLTNGFIGSFSNLNYNFKNPFTVMMVWNPESSLSRMSFMRTGESPGTGNPGGGGPGDGFPGDGPGIVPINFACSVVSIQSQATDWEMDRFLDWRTDELGLCSFCVEDGNPINTYRGDGEGRTAVIGFTWDGEYGRFFTSNGRTMNRSRRLTLRELDLSGIYNDYFGIQANFGNSKVSDIYVWQSALADATIQKYSAFLDSRYQTSARQIFVDPQSGTPFRNLGGLNSSQPYKFITTALNRVLAGHGDQILVKTGSTFGLDDPIDLMIFGNTSASRDIPMGYSPDYPFLLGTYGSIGDGRPDYNFNDDTVQYVGLSSGLDCIAIHQQRFRSSYRDPYSVDYVGYNKLRTNSAGSNGKGFGVIYYGASSGGGDENAVASGVMVTETEIANTARHHVAIKSANTADRLNNKFGGSYRSVYRDSWNPSEVSRGATGNNMYHGLEGDSNDDRRGMAGIYVESTGGFITEQNLFYRVGWQPGVTVAEGLIGTKDTSNNLAVASGGMSTGIVAWSHATNPDLDTQRVLVLESNGGAAVSPPGEVWLSALTGTNSVTISDADEGPTRFTDYTGTTLGVAIIDGAPRHETNVDVYYAGYYDPAVGSPLENGPNIGPLIVSNNIHIESSGYTTISEQGYVYYGNILQNCMTGPLASIGETNCSYNFMGGTSGVDRVRVAGDIKNSLDSIFTGGGLRAGSLRIGTTPYGVQRFLSVTQPFSGETPEYIRLNNNIQFIESPNDMVGSTSYFASTADFVGAEFAGGMIFMMGPADEVLVEKNTTHASPGSVYYLGGANENGVTVIQFNRNIAAQTLDFASSALYSSVTQKYVYGARKWNQSSGEIVRTNDTAIQGGLHNIYYITGGFITTALDMPFIHLTPKVNEGTDPDGGFSFWYNRKGSFSDEFQTAQFTLVDYEDVGRSLHTYNGLGTYEFASVAIAAHHQGYSSALSGDSALEWIRAGWKPTGRDAANYGNDYFGAVEFAISTGLTIAPLTTTTHFHGFGRGF